MNSNQSCCWTQFYHDITLTMFKYFQITLHIRINDDLDPTMTLRLYDNMEGIIEKVIDHV